MNSPLWRALWNEGFWKVQLAPWSFAQKLFGVALCIPLRGAHPYALIPSKLSLRRENPSRGLGHRDEPFPMECSASSIFFFVSCLSYFIICHLSFITCFSFGLFSRLFWTGVNAALALECVAKVDQTHVLRNRLKMWSQYTFKSTEVVCLWQQKLDSNRPNCKMYSTFSD